MRNQLTPALRASIARTVQITAALGLAAGAWLVVTPAQSAVVPNIFVRTCTGTDSNCSLYKQSNPPFVASLPNECMTKGDLFAKGGTYTLPAGQSCPNTSRV